MFRATLFGWSTLSLLIALTSPAASAQDHASWTADGAVSSGVQAVALGDGGFCYVLEAVGAPTAVPAAIRTTKRAPDGTVAWTRDFQSAHDDIAYSVAVDTDGSVYVAGVADQTLTFPPPVVHAQFLLLKYSSTGVLEWSSSPAQGGAGALVLDHAGGVFVVGTEVVGAVTTRFVRRYSSAGAVLWTVPFTGTSPISLAMSAPSHLYVGGSADGDFLVARLDPATGATVWSRTLDFGPQSNDSLVAIAAGLAGEVAVAGENQSNANSSKHWGVALYDDQGNLRWQRQLADGALINDKLVRDVALDPAGRVVVLGAFQYNSARSYDIATAVWDGAGALAWWHPYISESRDLPGALAVDEGGNVVVTGVRASDEPESQGIAVRYDAAGNARWVLVDPDPAGPGSAAFGDVAARDGSFVITGSRRTAGTTRSWVARYDPDNAAFCFGDGSGAACPCGNSSAPAERAGCASSLGLGARLDFAGTSSLSHDSLALDASSLTGTTALFFQGTTLQSGGSGAVFGDGLRCAAGSIVRLGAQGIGSGAARYPEAGDASVSIRGAVGAPGTRTYQTWYRNAASFCTSATFNLTNGLSIAWRS